MQARIEELEIRIAYQEEAIQTLSREVHLAHEALAALRSQVEQLLGSVDGMVRQSSGGHEVPPHY